MTSDNFGIFNYSSSLVGYCCQDLFSMTRNILECVPSNLDCNCFVRTHAVEPYTKADSNTALKKFLFKLLSKEDFQIVFNLLRALQALAIRTMTSFSMGHMLLLRYLKCSTFFKIFPITVFISSFYNHGHNILWLFDTLQSPLFTTNETKRHYEK